MMLGVSDTKTTTSRKITLSATNNSVSVKPSGCRQKRRG